MPAVDVTGPKGPVRPEGAALPAWARRQLTIAEEIVDNPGGGLLFATQAIGQVKAALDESDRERWAEVVDLLDRAEDAAVRREFDECRALLREAGRQVD
jgi:hypothetical protein